MGWIPQHLQKNGLSCFCCWQNHVVLAFLFPVILNSFFCYLLGMLRAVCAWLWVHLECVFWRGVPGFTLPPPRQSLPRFFHLFSPLTSSCSLIFTSIFSQLLRDRGWILILLLLVHPIIIALILNSGFGHYFFFFCSFQEPSFNLKSLQMPWSKWLQPSRRCQITPKLLGMRCFTSKKTL